MELINKGISQHFSSTLCFCLPETMQADVVLTSEFIDASALFLVYLNQVCPYC